MLHTNHTPGREPLGNLHLVRWVQPGSAGLLLGSAGFSWVQLGSAGFNLYKLRVISGTETKDFPAKYSFIDHTIKEEIKS